MKNSPIEALPVFLSVAREKSFRKAAAALGVTTPAVSQRIRKLEEELGVVLFHRTTRSVTLTEAGQQLFERSSSAVAELHAALAATAERSKEPQGLLRLSVPRIAVPLVLLPVLPVFRQRFPLVHVELHIDDALRQLAEHGYDAGIRLGSMVDRDLVTARLTAPFRSVIVGSPAYFARHGRPRTLRALRSHELIGYRNITRGDVYRWEVREHGQDRALELRHALLVDDAVFMIEAALAGLGLAYTFDALTAKFEREGRLERVLDAHGIREPGLHLYFAPRAESAPKLRAFIDTARAVLGVKNA